MTNYMQPMKLFNKIIYLAIFAVAVLVLFAVIDREIPKAQKEPEMTPEGQAKDKPGNDFILIEDKNVCEGCHMSGKPFIPQAETAKPHVNGGYYCLSCHIISHEKHPMNANITCEKCHGASPTVPVYFNGSISCNNCHDYPDPLLPSKGNLITIHKPRGVSCTNCHTDKCSKCHTEIGKTERWEKRMEHFKVVAMGQ